MSPSTRPTVLIMHRLLRARFCTQKLQKFTAFLEKESEEQAKGKGKGGEGELVPTGRAWLAAELRLKSNEDLHRLWYVLLQEKNSIISDSVYYLRATNRKMPKTRMEAVEKSMVRLKHVLQERNVVRQSFHEFLEEEYARAQRDKFRAQYEAQKTEESLAPQFSFSLLRAKFEALRANEDNLAYIDEHQRREDQKAKLRETLREKYDYRNKRVTSPGENKDGSTILTFKSQIAEQLKANKTRISQEEVLRAHVRNWRQLNIPQRRIVLGYLNAMRARDAKREFVKEINLLSQKIAYEEKNLQKDAHASPSANPAAN